MELQVRRHMTATRFPPIAPATPFRHAPYAATTARPARRRDRPWDLLIVALAVYIVMAVGRAHQLFPPIDVVKPLLLASILAVGTYLFVPGGGPLRRPILLRHSLPLRCMAGLLLWGLLSIPGALWVGNSFSTVVNGLLKTVVMAAVIVGAVRGVEDVERLAAAFFGSVAIYSLVILTRFHVDSDHWRLGGLYYYDANDFATLAVSALPLGLYFAVQARGWLRRGVAIAGLAAVAAAFVWCGSRGGLLAALAAGACIVFGATTISFTRRLVAATVVTGVFLGTASDAFWDKMGTLLHPGQDYNLESDEGRSAIWKRGVGYMIRAPFFGVGAGDFPVAEGTISPLAERQSIGRGTKWGAAHNSYVQIGAETGIPGLLWFVAMLLTALAGLRQVWRRSRLGVVLPDPRGPPLAQALAAALIGFAVGAAFLSLAYADALYVLVALAAAQRRVTPL